MDLSDWVVMFSRGWQPISSSPWGQLKTPSHNFSAPMQPPGGGQGNWPTGQRWGVVAVGEGCVPVCEERLLIEKPQARKGKLNTLCYLKKTKKTHHSTSHLIHHHSHWLHRKPRPVDLPAHSCHFCTETLSLCSQPRRWLVMVGRKKKTLQLMMFWHENKEVKNY